MAECEKIALILTPNTASWGEKERTPTGKVLGKKDEGNATHCKWRHLFAS